MAVACDGDPPPLPPSQPPPQSLESLFESFDYSSVNSRPALSETEFDRILARVSSEQRAGALSESFVTRFGTPPKLPTYAPSVDVTCGCLDRFEPLYGRGAAAAVNEPSSVEPLLERAQRPTRLLVAV